MNPPGNVPSDSFARDFPILRDGLYANHAAIAPWPRATREAVEAFARENAEHGPAAYRDWLQLERRLRRRLAGLVNADGADSISLLPNTSEGVSIVANGLHWRSGDNIVTPQDEFPSNRLAWEALQVRGVDIRRVDIRGARDPEDALLGRIDGRTRVLTVSSVQWSDGFRLDLARLGAGCRSAGALFFVDAIQQLGALPLDVRGAHIDCLAAGAHKWLLGPEGMGVFYCAEPVRESLALHRHGWRMLDDPFRYERPGRAPTRSGRRFEPGSPNSMGQVALDASLGVLERYGQDAVAEWVSGNTDALIRGLGEVPGMEVLSRGEAPRRSGIVLFRSTRVDNADLYRGLVARRVSCVLRSGAIRLSPHFYQHGAPLARILAAVEASAVSDK